MRITARRRIVIVAKAGPIPRFGRMAWIMGIYFVILDLVDG